MPLPKIMHAQFDIKVPSLNKSMKFRQMLVKEEKILLVAKTSKDDADILTAVKQVVQNCSMDDTFNVDTIAVFDLEYIFMRIRAISISNVIDLSFRDFEDDKVYDFKVNLDEIDIKMPKKVDNKITITDTEGLIMRWPAASIYSDKKFLDSTPEDATVELIARCIEKVYDADAVYDTTTFTKEEIKEFVENLDVKTFDKINAFLTSAPRLSHVITYKNSLDHERKIELSSLNDFFTLR